MQADVPMQINLNMHLRVLGAVSCLQLLLIFLPKTKNKLQLKGERAGRGANANKKRQKRVGRDSMRTWNDEKGKAREGGCLQM